jgi:hypothetical protein
MWTNKRWVAVGLAALILQAPLAFASGDPEVNVMGTLGLSQSIENSCFAIWVPVPANMAISSMKWYNNDGLVTFPEVLVQSGSPDYPVALPDAFPVAAGVVGPSSGWGEVVFSSLVGSTSGGVYVIFRVPDGVATTAEGAGGGPAIGYTTAGSGLPGWLSADGVDWEPLRPDFGFAVQPVLVEGTPGITLKSNGRSGAPGGKGDPGAMGAVSYPTSLEPAAPNPFNPQTTLKYSLRDASEVNLAIYNLRGELVKQLVHEHQNPGAYAIVWDGRGREGAAVASGMYLARFVAADVIMTQRLMLVQ